MNAIEVSHLCKRYRMRGMGPQTLLSNLTRLIKREPAHWFEALKDVSFNVPAGTTVGVIGPNGSGKSSLLGLIAGTISPTSGTIRTQGRIASLLELGAGFHPELTGRENVYLNAAILGIAREEVRRRFNAIADFSGIGEFMDMPVKTYSSGMYVRLGFSVAVEMDPDILLIDEVLAVGDVSFQFKCLDRIRDFQRKGKTMLFVSHGMRTIEDFCDQVCLISEGCLVEQGPPEKTILRYLEQFLGDKGSLVTTEYGTREIEIEDVRLSLADGHESADFLSGQPILIDIHYKAKKKIENPVFGYSIKQRDGFHIYGSNTQIMNYPIACVEGKGVMRLTIDELPLIQGKFFLSIATHSWDHSIQYHRREDWYPFNVTNPNQDEGYVRIQAHWEMRA